MEFNMKTYVSYEPSGHSNYRKLEALITKLGGTVENDMGSPFIIGGFPSPDAAKKYAAAIYAAFKEKPQISNKTPFSFGEGKSIKMSELIESKPQTVKKSELRALVKEEIRSLMEKDDWAGHPASFFGLPPKKPTQRVWKTKGGRWGAEGFRRDKKTGKVKRAIRYFTNRSDAQRFYSLMPSRAEIKRQDAAAQKKLQLRNKK